ncbi:MAG: hypothetical protein ACI4KD_07080 [Oscillospiraceae bacterium]
MNSKQLLKRLEKATKGRPIEEWDDEAKNAYIDLLKYDFSVSGKIFYELLESEPVKRPVGDTYVLKLDSEARSTLLSVLSAFRSYNCTQYARRVGRSFSAVDYHINKKEFFIQFNELTGHNES